MLVDGKILWMKDVLGACFGVDVDRFEGSRDVLGACFWDAGGSLGVFGDPVGSCGFLL